MDYVFGQHSAVFEQHMGLKMAIGNWVNSRTQRYQLRFLPLLQVSSEFNPHIFSLLNSNLFGDQAQFLLLKPCDAPKKLSMVATRGTPQVLSSPQKTLRVW